MRFSRPLTQRLCSRKNGAINRLNHTQSLFSPNLSSTLGLQHNCNYISNLQIQQPLRYFTSSQSININPDQSEYQGEQNQKDNKTDQEKKIALYDADFFGEPVTFLVPGTDLSKNEGTTKTTINLVKYRMECMEALNNWILAVLSRGKTSDGGGDGYGSSVQAKHSLAMTWSKLIRRLCFMQQQTSPMLVVAVVAPILIHAGPNYLRHLDTLLEQTPESVSLLSLAQHTATHPYTDAGDISPREKLHILSLRHLLDSDLPAALQTLQRLLHACPGDAFALSLSLDICHVLGDSHSALRISGSVASYWKERDRRHILSQSQTSYHPSQYALGSAWVALGYAAGRRYKEAEHLAEQIPHAERLSLTKGASGISAYALAHIYEGEGRTSEGISLLKGYDGTQQYEGCGMFGFDSKLAGFGARFSLDRDGSAADSVGLRIYESSFDRVLESYLESLNPPNQQLQQQNSDDDSFYETPLNEEEDTLTSFQYINGMRTAPTHTRSEMMKNVQNSTQSFLDRIFGASSSKSKNSEMKQQVDKPNQIQLEDVLTWIPPTPSFFMDATLLLLRLTLSGAITPQDQRWDTLMECWNHMRHHLPVNTANEKKSYPMVNVLSHLFLKVDINDDTNNQTTISEVSKGLTLFSQLMKFGSSSNHNAHDNVNDNKDETAMKWKHVVHHLASATEGGTNLSTLFSSSQSNDNSHNIGHSIILTPPSSEIHKQTLAWDIDLRPIYEHILCYAACESNDLECIYLARSICSESIALRPNCPEAWWRYSLILDALGDKVAAQDARHASISLGSGEGRSGGGGFRRDE